MAKKSERMQNLIVIGHPDEKSFCYNGIFKTIKKTLLEEKGYLNEVEVIDLYRDKFVRPREELIANSKDGKRAQNTTFDETTGSINYLNKKVPVRIRLKGDRASHYIERDKSSYKITIRGDEKIMGIKKFSFI